MPILPKERRLRFQDRVQSLLFVVEVLLGLRVFFLLAGSASQGFVKVIYLLTDPLVAPFRLLIPSVQLDPYYYDPASAVAFIAVPLLLKIGLNAWHGARQARSERRLSEEISALP